MDSKNNGQMSLFWMTSLISGGEKYRSQPERDFRLTTEYLQIDNDPIIELFLPCLELINGSKFIRLESPHSSGPRCCRQHDFSFHQLRRRRQLRIILESRKYMKKVTKIEFELQSSIKSLCPQ